MPQSQTGSCWHTYIEVTYRCQRINMVLLAHIYRCHGLTHTSHIKILCHDICILLFLRFIRGFRKLYLSRIKLTNIVAKLIYIQLLHIYIHIFHFNIYSSHLIKLTTSICL
ncbi:hypothetical protein F383_23154 [Gossypium arboreum]|uniref:Uncharacterized protein n=1 Tax=Gossypium arboreum TaxID=29729 RepID=A0A0B0NWV5_GOSAR|nr:hypothetical protein F383_23154 [Gossypium arboreum]